MVGEHLRAHFHVQQVGALVGKTKNGSAVGVGARVVPERRVERARTQDQVVGQAHIGEEPRRMGHGHAVVHDVVHQLGQHGDVRGELGTPKQVQGAPVKRGHRVVEIHHLEPDVRVERQVK